MTRLGDDLMLCNVSVANLPLQAVIPAAAAAGFSCISVLARAHRRAVERDGVTTADFLGLLADHGVRVQEVEAAGDWLGPLPVAERPWLDPVYSVDRMLSLAEELGARTVVATHFGAVASTDVAAEAFAALCDRAADVGCQVALEFPAMATVTDLGGAWEIVRTADRANGGILVDNWHHRRGGGTDDQLRSIPAERILSVQLSDGATEAVGPLIDDVARRVLPGDGELDVAASVRALDRHGVSCPLGIEVLQRDIVKDGPGPAAERLYASLAGIVEHARGEETADGHRR